MQELLNFSPFSSNIANPRLFDTLTPKLHSKAVNAEPAVQKGWEATFSPIAKQTEWSQGQPPSGLGYVAPQIDQFALRNNDVGPNSYGVNLDGWRPLYREKWMHMRNKQIQLENNTLNYHSTHDFLLHTNVGSTISHPGVPLWIYPAHPPKVFHPLSYLQQADFLEDNKSFYA